MITKPRVFAAKFKNRAVQLVLNEKMSINKVSKDLDIGIQNLSRWVQQHQKSLAEQRPAFTGRGVVALTEQEKRIQELERENYILRQEREICLDPKTHLAGGVA